MLSDSLFGQSANAWVNDRFEFLSGVGIIEDNRPDLLPIESLVGLQDVGAESLDDFFPRILAGFNDIPR